MPLCYETQDIRAATTRSDGGYVWHCQRCGRYLGTIDRLDGSLSIRHKCGGTNHITGMLAAQESALDAGDEHG